MIATLKFLPRPWSYPACTYPRVLSEGNVALGKDLLGNARIGAQKKLLAGYHETNGPSTCLPQEKSQIQKDLWRIEDVLAGLSANKENFRILVESVKNPGECDHFPAWGSPLVKELSVLHRLCFPLAP